MTQATPNSGAQRVKFMRPLLDVRGWRLFTGKGEDVMLAEIDCGNLRFAFDIAGPGAKRMTVRLWVKSLISFLHPSEKQGPQTICPPRSIRFFRIGAGRSAARKFIAPSTPLRSMS